MILILTIKLEKSCWNIRVHLICLLSFIFTYYLSFRIRYSQCPCVDEWYKTSSISAYSLLPGGGQAWLPKHSVILSYFTSLYCSYYSFIFFLHTYFFICLHSPRLPPWIQVLRELRLSLSNLFLYLQDEKQCLKHGQPSVNIDIR